MDRSEGMAMKSGWWILWAIPLAVLLWIAILRAVIGA